MQKARVTMSHVQMLQTTEIARKFRKELDGKTIEKGIAFLRANGVSWGISPTHMRTIFDYLEIRPSRVRRGSGKGALGARIAKLEAEIAALTSLMNEIAKRLDIDPLDSQ